MSLATQNFPNTTYYYTYDHGLQLHFIVDKTTLCEVGYMWFNGFSWEKEWYESDMT